MEKLSKENRKDIDNRKKIIEKEIEKKAWKEIDTKMKKYGFRKVNN